MGEAGSAQRPLRPRALDGAGHQNRGFESLPLRESPHLVVSRPEGGFVGFGCPLAPRRSATEAPVGARPLRVLRAADLPPIRARGRSGRCARMGEVVAGRAVRSPAEWALDTVARRGTLSAQSADLASAPRVPEDFMFQLTKAEFDNSRYQSGTSGSWEQRELETAQARTTVLVVSQQHAPCHSGADQHSLCRARSRLTRSGMGKLPNSTEHRHRPGATRASSGIVADGNIDAELPAPPT